MSRSKSLAERRVALTKALFPYSFAAGKPTALVIDIGDSGMSAIPVVDGFILRKGIHRQPIGGRAISKALLYSLQNPPPQNVRLGKLTEVIPQYLVQSKVAVDPGRPSQAQLRQDRLSVSISSAFRRLAGPSHCS